MYSGPSQGRKRWRLNLPKVKAETPSRPSIMHILREPIWRVAQGKHLSIHVGQRANVAEMNHFCDGETSPRFAQSLLWHCAGTTILSGDPHV